MKKQTKRLALRKETLVHLQGVRGGTGATTTAGTTSLVIVTLTGGGGGGGEGTGDYHDTVYRTEPVEVNDTVIRY
ncbi:MAG TPA: hypothetical protein VHN15_11045 [Thermoanaerobaculia bacterium]|nr:hypothetical protein [Thermoanaerobaculia bacterium]